MQAYKHLKTGKVYILMFTAYMEGDRQHVVVYRRLGGNDATETWVRPADEFFDGRFALIDMEA